MKLDHSMIISIITVVMLVLNYIKKTDFPKELAIKNESFSAPDLSLGTTLAHPNPKSHKNQTLLKKMITLQINSWDRDTSMYPTAQSFVYTLESPLYNVESVELVRASIPRTEYSVNHNNKFMEALDINSNVVIEIELEIGEYNILEYCDQLTDMFGGTQLPLVFTFNPGTSPPVTTDILVSCVKEFHLLYGTGQQKEYSNFPNLGFVPEDMKSTYNSQNALWELRGHRVDILGARYVDIDIDELSTWSSNPLKPTNVLASIALDINAAITIFEPQNTGPKRYFNPHGMVSQITLNFYDNTPYKARRLYNFEGLEHSITLGFTVLYYKGEIPPLARSS